MVGQGPQVGSATNQQRGEIAREAQIAQLQAKATGNKTKRQTREEKERNKKKFGAKKEK